MDDYTKKDKGVAALLAFLAGPLGVHKFYLKKTKAGLLYLLFFWFPLVWVLGFVDFVSLLVMSQDEFDLKYNLNPRMPLAGRNTKPAIEQENVPEQIEKYAKLLEQGYISSDEFILKKRELLGIEEVDSDIF